MGLNCYKVPSLKDPILETLNISYLQDRYILGEELGWGQFGVIKSCFDMVTGESLACKSIAKERLVSNDNLQAVKLEIEVMSKLSGHPNVVELKAVYEEEEFVHLVMELCAGGELFHRIEKCGRFCEGDACRLFKHLMEVILYCHEKGIVHRDLKPENILLATKSSLSEIKLADFGLATYIKPGQSLHGTVGSPFYIAPEVLSGGYNEAADLWSAGVILYILLCGMPPFWGKTKSQIFESVRSAELRFPSDPWEHVSDSAKNLVTGMLQRDPKQRLNAKQVLEHSWIKNFSNSYSQCNTIINTTHQQTPTSFPLSTLNVSATRDVSFGFTTPVSCHHQQQHTLSYPTFTCKSSFSNSNIGFSFRNESNETQISSLTQFPLIQNFSFFSPLPPNEPEIIPLDIKADISKVEIDIGKDIGEFRRRRHHTIGLGEHLGIIVSETVIRWSSCTCVPSAHSLQSSLVC